MNEPHNAMVNRYLSVYYFPSTYLQVMSSSSNNNIILSTNKAMRTNVIKPILSQYLLFRQLNSTPVWT